MAQIFVQDDFYPDPMHIRRLAMSSSMQSKKIPDYPGFQSAYPYQSQDSRKKIESIISTPIKFDPQKNTFGFFRTCSLIQTLEFPMVINTPNTWKAIVFLNTPDQCQGGVSFYKHKESSLYGIKKITNKSEKQAFIEDQGNEEKWDCYQQVKMKFNRIVIFKSKHLFHRDSSSFGVTFQTSRLTQEFFFDLNLGAQKTAAL